MTTKLRGLCQLPLESDVNQSSQRVFQNWEEGKMMYLKLVLCGHSSSHNFKGKMVGMEILGRKPEGY